MGIKLFGAMLVMLSCGGFGFAMCLSHKRAEQELRQFIAALQWMSCELSVRCSPLPSLLRGASDVASGGVGAVFLQLACELEDSREADVSACLDHVLSRTEQLSSQVLDHMADFGTTLGCFDLPGQQQGMQRAIAHAQSTLNQYTENRSQRLRIYQTLGLCGGAALAILFL